MWASMRLITERLLHFEWWDNSSPWFAISFFFFFLCSKSESLIRTVFKTRTLLQSDRTIECLSFNLFITVPFYRFSWIKNNKIYNWICIHLYMNVYKIIYPLLECRSWLPFVCFVWRRGYARSLSLFPLIVCTTWA